VATAATATPQPKVATPRVATAVPAGQAPKVAVPAKAAPKVAVAAQAPRAASAAPSAHMAAMSSRPSSHHEIKEDDAFHPFKWLCLGLGSLIVLIVGANFFLVNLPLTSRFAHTSYSNVRVYAHFGAFMQPNVMVIHIPPSTQITPETLPAVLVALARSTPDNPITRDSFARIALTSGWTAQYSFSGESWKQLADLDQETEEQRKEFLMAQMDDASGQSLMPESTLNEEAQQAKREQVWKAFVAHFTTQP
jgi:hypothetical protein